MGTHVECTLRESYADPVRGSRRNTGTLHTGDSAYVQKGGRTSTPACVQSLRARSYRRPSGLCAGQLSPHRGQARLTGRAEGELRRHPADGWGRELTYRSNSFPPDSPLAGGAEPLAPRPLPSQGSVPQAVKQPGRGLEIPRPHSRKPPNLTPKASCTASSPQQPPPLWPPGYSCGAPAAARPLRSWRRRLRVSSPHPQASADCIR